MNYRRMVPNSISGLSMVLGVLSIYLSMDGEFSRAAIFIIFSRPCRFLRWTGCTSSWRQWGIRKGNGFHLRCLFFRNGSGCLDLYLWSYGSGSFGDRSYRPSSLLARDCAWLVSMSTRACFLGILKGCRAAWCLRPCDLCAFWLSIWVRWGQPS